MNRPISRLAVLLAGLHLALLLVIWKLYEVLEDVWGPTDFMANPNWDWASPIFGTSQLIFGLPLYWPAVALFNDGPLVHWTALVLNSILWGFGVAAVARKIRSATARYNSPLQADPKR